MMFVYRLSKEKYSKKLKASGASNRWNLDGQYVLYTGSSRALSSLEQLVHLAGIIPKANYKMVVIQLIDIEHLIKEIKLSDLGKNWRRLSEYHKHQIIGSKWYEDQDHLLLKVPSAIITEEFNYVINTSHSDFKKKVKIKTIEDYFWDERLFNK